MTGPVRDTPTGVEPLWDVTTLAAYLRIPENTLYQWRRKGTGPPASKCGRYLRYDPALVREWLTALTR